MADIHVPLSGWGYSTWNSGTWGTEVPLPEATGSVGTVTVVQGAGVSTSVTGLAGTGSVGTVTVAQGTGVSTSVTGLAATGSEGVVTVSTGTDVSVQGISASTSVGNVLVWGDIIPNPGNTWNNITPNPGNTWEDIAA